LKEQDAKVKRTLFRKIVNVFIGLFISLIILFLIAFGISQTYTFREYLREELISRVNEEINGSLNIERLDGTFFTSIMLKNSSIIFDNDTLLFVKNIDLKVSPLHLLLKKIYIRSLNVEDVIFNRLEDESNNWNLAALIKTQDKSIDTLAEAEISDTTNSGFPFMIQVNNLKLVNINFRQQAFNYLNSTSNYVTVNTDDFRVRNLNLEASLFVDIAQSRYSLLLKNLSFNPNFENFQLNEFSGYFEITNEYALVKSLVIKTSNSDLQLNARMDDFNLFGGSELKDFKEYPIELELRANPFYFDDLSSYLQATDFIKGSPALSLKADGVFGNINIRELKLDYLSTHLELNGSLRNLHTPSKLFIDAEILDSRVVYKNVNELLPTLDLPQFNGLEFVSMRGEFHGEPTNFSAIIDGELSQGAITATSTLNLTGDVMKYDVQFITENVDLSPIINLPSSINAEGFINGVGVSPENLNMNFDFEVANSTLGGFDIDTLKVKSSANTKVINLNVFGRVNEAESKIQGSLNFEDSTSTAYELDGEILNLNLARFTNNSMQNSGLNFSFNADGNNLDLEKITGNFFIALENSYYGRHQIDKSDLYLDLERDSTFRQINLTSDFADINFYGDFSLAKGIELLSDEIDVIGNIISQKVEELNPLNLISSDSVSVPVNFTQVPKSFYSDLEINFDFKFKDFKLIAMLLENENFEISGYGSGLIQNDSTNFLVDTELNLNYVLLSDSVSSLYLSDLQTNLNFSRDNRSLSFDKIFGSVSTTANKIYSGSEFNNVFADLIFNEDMLFINLYGETENTLKAEIEASVNMTPVTQEISLEKIWVQYKGLDWQNSTQANIIVSPDNLEIKNIHLQRDSSKIIFDGTLAKDGTQDFKLSVNDLSASVLGRYFFDLTQDQLESNINLNTSITGTFSDPVIDLNLSTDALSFRDAVFGQWMGSMNYSAGVINTDIRFIDTLYNYSSPLLSVSGSIPINLSFNNIDKRFDETKEIDISVKANRFQLSSFGQILPVIDNQKGTLDADIHIGGTNEQIEYKGALMLAKGAFRVRQNNLSYNLSTVLTFRENDLVIDKFAVSNTGDSNLSGRLNGTGQIEFDGLSIDNIELRLLGDLAVLGKRTESVNPYFYGDLLFATDGEWIFRYNNEKSFFKGKVLLKETNLTYIPTQNSDYSSNNNFKYNIIEDTTQIDDKEVIYQKLLQEEYEASLIHQEPINFDFEIDVDVVNDAKMEFILARAANQRLVVEARGDIHYESIDGESRAQGEFLLLDGSKLEFFKSFDAVGKIRFETDIADPYLDIVATYTADYESAVEIGKTEPVAVKFILQGPVSELGKNFISNPNNIAVYVGTRNIDNNVADTRYDVSDAFSFILVGKFKDDLTTTDKNQVASQTAALNNTATSFLGSMLTGYVNSAIGDVINNIQLTQSGEYTKFIISGKFQNLKYKFGGTTEIFQNINKANVRIDYFFNQNFLIRLERKDPIVQSFGIDEKINELGLKYRFEF